MPCELGITRVCVMRCFRQLRFWGHPPAFIALQTFTYLYVFVKERGESITTTLTTRNKNSIRGE